MNAPEVMVEYDLFVSGHRACHGCGLALGVRHILKAAGKEVIVVSPTGCLETFSSPYGYSPWRSHGFIIFLRMLLQLPRVLWRP